MVEKIVKQLSEKFNKKKNLIKCMIEDTMKDSSTIYEAKDLIEKFYN